MARFTPPLLALLLLAACRTPPPEGAFVDDLGRAVEVRAPAQRVIPLAPSLTEVVAAAGGLDRLVAVSPWDDYPEGVRGLPRLSVQPLDLEAVVGHRADLALGTAQVNNPADGDRLGALGVPAVYLRFETLADVPRALRQVGGLLGTEPAADSAAAAFEGRLQAFEAAAPAGERPGVLVLIGDDVLYAFGRASYVHEMVRLAGGRSLTAGLPGEGLTLSEEFVLAERPEVIVVLAGPDYDGAGLSRRRPTWRALPAIAAGRVCGVDPNLVVRPGPRLTGGVEALRSCIGGEGGQSAGSSR